MKLLIDNASSPVVAIQLMQNGHGMVHARDIRMQEAEDEALLLRAEAGGPSHRIGGYRLRNTPCTPRMPKPSSVLLRRTKGSRPEEVVRLFAELLPRVSEDLKKGSVVTVTDDRVRMRALPVHP